MSTEAVREPGHGVIPVPKAGVSQPQARSSEPKCTGPTHQAAPCTLEPINRHHVQGLATPGRKANDALRNEQQEKRSVLESNSKDSP